MIKITKLLAWVAVVIIIFALFAVWNILQGKTYKDDDIKITFSYYCTASRIPYRSGYDVSFKKIMEVPYKVISCSIPEYTFETDGVIPADFYNLKIFYGNDFSKLTFFGLNDEITKINPELIIKKILLPLENYQILNFKITENKPIKKNSLDGYYIKAMLNREGKGEFFVEAIIYHRSLENKFYILSAYYEDMRASSDNKRAVEFFNSFKIK